MSSIGPGAAASQGEAGKNSANQFNAAISAGSNAKGAMRQIDQIMGAAQGLQTGPGSEALSGIKSAYNALRPGWLPQADPGPIAKFDEMKKNAAALGEQLSQGGGGTDARLKNALDSLPNAHYSPAAIQEVSYNLKGMQSAALAKAQAAAAWQQTKGPGDYPTFERQWQQAFNPDVFYHMAKGPQDFAKWANSMSPSDRARTLGQYRTMKQMGGF